MVALGDCAIAGARHSRLRMRRQLTSRTFLVSTLEIPTLVPLPRHERTTQIFPNGWRIPALWVVRVNFQVGKEELLATWLMASAVWFDRHKDGIDLFQLLRIIKFHYPSLLGRVVLIEDAKACSLLSIKTVAAPSLKCAGTLEPRLLVEIIRIEDQRLSFGIEDPTIGLLRLSVTRNVKYLGNIKVPSTHQFADIPVVGKQLLLLAKILFAVAKLSMKIPYLSF